MKTALTKALQDAKNHRDDPAMALSDLMYEVEKFLSPEYEPRTVKAWAIKLGVNPDTFNHRAWKSKAGTKFKKDGARVLDWLEARELAKPQKKGRPANN